MDEIKNTKETQTPMNENLSQMVKDSTPDEVIFSESDLDLPVEPVTEAPAENETPAEEAAPAEATVPSIPVSTLSDWFETNCANLDNINQVKVSIRGVDANKTLIMAVKDGAEQDDDGNAKRTLRVFDNADSLPVLNISPVSMDVYNNGFKIVYQLGEDTFIKAYGIRTGLICTFCVNIGGKLIPYHIERIKKKDEALEQVPSNSPEYYTSKLAGNADLEALQLLYKQAAKEVENLSTVQSVVDWLVERQDSVTDINHHLQIDNVIIDILK